MINLQMTYPAITQSKGAIQEIEFPFLTGCTDVELFAAGLAVGFASAMIVCF
jgi:hypothetical protein